MTTSRRIEAFDLHTDGEDGFWGGGDLREGGQKNEAGSLNRGCTGCLQKVSKEKCMAEELLSVRTFFMLSKFEF